MTKHSHKYPTAFPFVQRWFSGVLHSWASLYRVVTPCHNCTFSHSTHGHTDTQRHRCKVQSQSTLALTSEEPPPLPPPAKLFLSQLSFSKDEAQPDRRGTATTMLFKNSKKEGWGMRAVTAGLWGAGSFTEGRGGRGRGTGERGWMRGKRWEGGKKGEREALDKGDTEKRRRNGETRGERDRHGGWGPATARTPSRRGAVPARSGEQTAGAKHRKQPPTARTRSPWPWPLTPSVRPGHRHSPGPPQREWGRRRPRDPGAGRAARDRGGRAALARHRPAPPREAANHNSPSLPPPSASQWERASPQRHARPSLWAEGSRAVAVSGWSWCLCRCSGVRVFPVSSCLPVSGWSRCLGLCRCFGCSRCPTLCSRSLPVRLQERILGLHFPPRVFTQRPVLTSHPCFTADKGEHHLLIKAVVRDHPLPVVELPLPFISVLTQGGGAQRVLPALTTCPSPPFLPVIVALWKCLDFMCIHTH